FVAGPKPATSPKLVEPAEPDRGDARCAGRIEVARGASIEPGPLHGRRLSSSPGVAEFETARTQQYRPPPPRRREVESRFTARRDRLEAADRRRPRQARSVSEA